MADRSKGETMRESEATKLICPFTRADGVGWACVGSKCMGWRGLMPEEVPARFKGDHPTPQDSDPEGDCIRLRG